MPNGGLDIQTRVLLLPSDHLHPVLHVGHCLMGQLLAGPKRSPGPGLSRRDHPADDVHPDGLDQQLAAASGLHESHRRLDRGKIH